MGDRSFNNNGSSAHAVRQIVAVGRRIARPTNGKRPGLPPQHCLLAVVDYPGIGGPGGLVVALNVTREDAYREVQSRFLRRQRRGEEAILDLWIVPCRTLAGTEQLTPAAYRMLLREQEERRQTA